MKIKKELRNVTAKQYEAWRNEHCMGACDKCLFHSVCCSTSKNSWVNNKPVYSDWFLDQEIEIEIEVDKPKLTEDEKVILKNVDKKWKYITRDIDGKLCLFTGKPTKGTMHWHGPGANYFFFSMFHLLFSSITWEDEEPYSIEYLLAKEGR